MQPSHLSPNEAPDHDNPALSRVIERNIRRIIHLCTKDVQRRSPQRRIADAIPFLFVLICQNRLSEETELPADLDLPIGLLIEHKASCVLQMVDPAHNRFRAMRIVSKSTLRSKPDRKISGLRSIDRKRLS
jgi:hypothetical protein